MQTSRRSFLKKTAVLSLAFPAIVRGANLNSNLQIAAIGASGKGWSDISEIGSHPKVRFTGFADVDSSKFTQAAQKYPETPCFQDFREMFAKLGDTFDAVIVSTPDHLHACAGMAALRLKKHLYIQKPMTHTVWEARQMRLQATKAGVATQMGNQIHSASEYRTATKLLREEVIGKIKEVHCWQMKTGNAYTHLTGKIPEPGPVPEALNWDLWLGPAPQREFAPDAYHPEKWRDWQDFGGGVMGDFGCHILDPIFTGLELTAPLNLWAENDGTNPQTWPVGEVIYYNFPGSERVAGPSLPITWHDGGRELPEWVKALLPAEKKLPGSGSILIGEGGTMLLPHIGQPELFPGEKFDALPIVKEKSLNHYHAWVDAALGGPKTTADFDYAGPLTEAVQLANIATRMPGTLLEWDSASLSFPKQESANRLLTKTYRKGWEIEAVS